MVGKSQALGKKASPKETHEDKGAFLGYAMDGRELWSAGMDQECAKILKTHFANASNALSKDCRFVVCTDEESEDNLAEKIRNERGFDMASAEDTIVHYGVVLSGQASSAACHNPVTFRKAHFDKHIRGALHASVPPGTKAIKNTFNVDFFFD